MIKTVNLQKVFYTDEIETLALNNVNINVEKGEFVAIMGPSGCGKSTLLNILGLLDNPTHGEYYLNGTEVSKYVESQRTSLRKGIIGFVFQSFNLIDELNVYENIELPLLYMGVSASERKRKIEDVMNDIHPSGIKIGMINNAETAVVIAESIKKFKPEFVVLDPVMVSTSGSSLMEKDAVQAVKDHLFPLSTLITPNIKEAEALLQCDIKEKEAMKQAAKELLQYGSKAVLVKGGHLQQDAMYDILHICNEKEPHIYSLPKIESTNTHGTGCTLSSAITTFLVSGMPLQVAVCKAKEYVYQSILHGKDIQIGAGHGPLNHFHHPIPLHIIEDGSVSL